MKILQKTLLAISSLMLLATTGHARQSGSDTIPVDYVITNNTPYTASVWYGVSEGTVNNQWTQPMLAAGASTNGSFTLPLASGYEGFSQAQVFSNVYFTPPQCWKDIFPKKPLFKLKGLTSQVTVSGNDASGYSCDVQIQEVR